MWKKDWNSNLCEENNNKFVDILFFSGAFLFNSITNRPNHYVNQRLYGAPLPLGLRPTPLRKRRLRKKGQKFRKRRLRNRRPLIGGRRRLRKNMNIRRRPGTFIHPAQPQYTNYLNNHRHTNALKFEKKCNFFYSEMLKKNSEKQSFWFFKRPFELPTRNFS